jgi:hypothetical protein
MEYFYGGGGNNRPTFIYRFFVTKVTDDMFKWCEAYPLTGPFERWHAIFNNTTPGRYRDKEDYPIIQFESKKAALMFRIAYSEYIVQDISIYKLDNDD